MLKVFIIEHDEGHDYPQSLHERRLEHPQRTRHVCDEWVEWYWCEAITTCGAPMITLPFNVRC